MKKIMSLIFCIISLNLFAITKVDNLKREIDALPFSYKKGDKIWDLAIEHIVNARAKLALESYKEAAEIFVKLDSTSAAFSVARMALSAAIFDTLYVEEAEMSFNFLMTTLLDKRAKYSLSDTPASIYSYGILLESEKMYTELDAMVKKYLEVIPKGNLLFYPYEFILMRLRTNEYLYGQNVAITKYLSFYDELVANENKISFVSQKEYEMTVLSAIQNIYYDMGDIDQSNLLLDRALDIGFDVYQNHTDSLSVMNMNNMKNYIGVLLSLKVDNIPIKEENLIDIEKGFLDVVDYFKATNTEKCLNIYTKIAHAYDVIYSGKSDKTSYYLNQVASRFDLLKEDDYRVNYYLTKARYMLNNKKYEEADMLFSEAEKSIAKHGQTWLRFNYIMERSRYFWEVGRTKEGYDLVVNFYKNLNRNFSRDIADRTAQLNADMETAKLQNSKLDLEHALVKERIGKTRRFWLNIVISISLFFISILLILRVKANANLKSQLDSQSEKLMKEIKANEQTTQQLIIAERLASIGEIASSIAHEIKNPLTNIITSTQLIKDSKGEDDVVDNLVDISVRNAWRAIDKVNDLLDYAKQKKLNFEVTSLKELMQNALELAKGRLTVSDVDFKLEYHVHDDLISADRTELTGVIVNLIINSIEAIKDNGIITLLLTQTEDDILLSITDNGCGIPPAFIDQVRKPFFTTKESGAGLGLNYAEKVIIKHNGSLNLTSEQNKGTTIEMSFPKAEII